MKIKLNSKVYDIDEGTSLGAFLNALGIARKGGIAVAVEQEVIARNRWDEFILNDNSNIMLIYAVSGG